MKIFAQKNGTMNESDRLEIARLLVKAGYTVRIGKEKSGQKTNSANICFVECLAPGESFSIPRALNEKTAKATEGTEESTDGL